MEVRRAIDDLRSSLERITAEDDLFAVIADRLAALRQSCPSNGSLLTKGCRPFGSRTKPNDSSD